MCLSVFVCVSACLSASVCASASVFVFSEVGDAKFLINLFKSFDCLKIQFNFNLIFPKGSDPLAGESETD